MRKHLSTFILIFVFLIGLSVLLYPTLSDWWNASRQSKIINSYSQSVDNLADDVYDEILENAHAFNETLFESHTKLNLPLAMKEDYESQLNVDDTGAMGYIIIDKINCTLPIYHGAEEKTLQVAIGHIEGSSLPVGGESSHCVLSGHRGLPSAQLFSKLDKLEVGDTFILQVLNETLTYEVDQISIVLPNETQKLQIVEGEDLCTLMTCTPYGVNSHRLLVRGHRIENAEDSSVVVVSDATQLSPVLVAPAFAAPLFVIALILLLRGSGEKKKE